MEECKPVATPMSVNEKLSKNDGAAKVIETLYRKIVGSLVYLTSIRPDIMYALSIVLRFMREPSKLHYVAFKRILKYVKGTKYFGVLYHKNKDSELVGYTDSDWAGSLDDRKSTSGYGFFIGKNIISWSSKKQKTVALLTAEAEYVSATGSACEAIWLRRMLKDLRQAQVTPTTIFCNNMSSISMTKNPVFHSRMKHIEIHNQFIRELVEEKKIELKFCKTGDQVADIFTKPIFRDKFVYFSDKLGVFNFSELRRSVGK